MTEALLARVADLETAGCAPFAPGVMAMLARLSDSLMAGGRAPQLTALGYWLRPAALDRLRRDFAVPLAVPRGVALHLPPENVDTVFVYSWALSALAGNANVVRLPSAANAAVDELVGLIAAAQEASGESGRHLFCSYPRDGDMTRRLSALADVRLIWGGDDKVTEIGALPLRPGGLTLPFPDRHSFAAIAAPAYAALSEGERDVLAEKFFNDVYWFDQMACASPHALVWVGGNDGAGDFIARLERVVVAKGYRTPLAIALRKFAFANQMAAEERVDNVHLASNEMLVLEAAPAEALWLRHGGGTLAVCQAAQLDDVLPHLGRRHQTMSQFGFPSDLLHRFALAAGARGLARIVPMGQALGFDAVWDGMDLLRLLTRQVVVR